MGSLLDPWRAAARPSTPGKAPTEVSGLYGFWDAFDSAQYNGGGNFIGITDKGPNSLDMTVASGSPIPPTSYNVNGVATDLPGPFPVVVGTQHANTVSGLGLSLNDFTMMAIVPINSTRTTTSTMASLNLSGSPFYAVQWKQGSTASHLEISGSSAAGATQDVGFNNSALNGAHAIAFVRRTGTTLRMDSYYDQLLGGGLVQPTQVVGTIVGTALAIDQIWFGGRGSITFTWQGTAPIHMFSLWTSYVSDADLVDLAIWGGQRLGGGLAAIA